MEDKTRGSSPASRGGAGVYIEGELGAFYFLAMLAGTEARGMPGARISRVRFQGVDQGYTLDDLVLKGVGTAARQRTVNELLREASAIDGFTVIATARDGYGEHADFGDPSFMGPRALNVLDSANWVEVEGGRAYRSPADEAAHLVRLSARHGEITHNSEMEARIQLAIDGSQRATPETASDAVACAAGDLPDDTDTDSLKSRSTRLIATAMLVARDGDDALLDAHESWVREVIGRALSEESDRHSGSGDMLRFNRPAIGALALFHLWLRRGSKADRDALIAIAARRDRAGLPAFAAARERIVGTDPRLLKAAMRAAFCGYLWRWHPRDDDEVAQKRFEAERDAATERAVAAEIAWLDGGDEPAWPAFPGEKPILRRPLRMRVPGPTAFDDEDDDSAGGADGGAPRRMGDRTMSLRRWEFNGSPRDLSIDYDTGGVVAKLLLNTHGPFRGTRSYLVPAVADRLDPLLDPMRPLQPGGPTTFVALCTMNMLLVAPRARHLDFLLSAVEAWFDRLPTYAGIWITMGIGRNVVEWFEAAIAEEAGILGPTHPQRERIDRVLGRLVGVGVAEAHQMEKQIEQATMTDTRRKP